MKYLIFFLIFSTTNLLSQFSKFPYFQNFDSSYIIPPALPASWSSTQNRTPGTNDFTSTTSTTNSPPNTVVSTNARITQSLISPTVNFSNRLADSIKFFERRSSTHDSGLLLEASIDGGLNYNIVIGDTLKYAGHTNFFQRRFSIPTILNNQSNVRFRWRVVGNGNGSTGTIRFDDIEISVKTLLDIGIINMNYSPLFPVRGDTAQITITIKNFGLQTINNFSVSYYTDLNTDSTAQPGELFFSGNFNVMLGQNDTLRTSVNLPWMNLSELQMIALVNLTGDEFPANDKKIIKILYRQKKHSIIVNEIMYKPAAPEPEWIEIMNASEDSINLKNWKISDSKTSSRAAITTQDNFLKPYNFAVITKDTTNLFEVRPFIPGKIFTTTSLATFNNDSDAVVIFDQFGIIVDSVFYRSNWGGSGGQSLERIEYSISSIDSSNWISCFDSSGATPGRKNYSTPLENDLRAIRIYSTATVPYQPANIFVVIGNSGKNPVASFSVHLFHDLNSDSIPQQSEKTVTDIFNGIINYKDSVKIKLTWQEPGFGIKPLIALVDYNTDQRISNNIAYTKLFFSYPEKSLVVNEIMYAPLTGNCEYVELYNRAQYSVLMKEWKLHDIPDNSGKANEFKLGNSNIIVNPGEYLVLAADSALFTQFTYLADPFEKSKIHIFNKSSLSLNNEGDAVVIKDLASSKIDSVMYSPKWHNPELSDVSGRALERINHDLPANDPRNWSSCANPIGGTPGRKNSIHAENIQSSASLIFTPNPFSPDGDGYEDHCVISYNLSSSVSMIRLRIFDAKGRLIRTLVNNEPSGSSGQIIWDGMNDNREKVQIGIYIVFFEAFEIGGGTLNVLKGALVVATKL